MNSNLPIITNPVTVVAGDCCVGVGVAGQSALQMVNKLVCSSAAVNREVPSINHCFSLSGVCYDFVKVQNGIIHTLEIPTNLEESYVKTADS